MASQENVFAERTLKLIIADLNENEHGTTEKIINTPFAEAERAPEPDGPPVAARQLVVLANRQHDPIDEQVDRFIAYLGGTAIPNLLAETMMSKTFCGLPWDDVKGAFANMSKTRTRQLMVDITAGLRERSEGSIIAVPEQLERCRPLCESKGAKVVEWDRPVTKFFRSDPRIPSKSCSAARSPADS